MSLQHHAFPLYARVKHPVPVRPHSWSGRFGGEKNPAAIIWSPDLSAGILVCTSTFAISVPTRWFIIVCKRSRHQTSPLLEDKLPLSLPLSLCIHTHARKHARTKYTFKLKVKAHPRTVHEGSDGEYRYGSTLSLTSALGVVCCLRHAPAALPLRKIWVDPRAALDGCGKSRTHQDSIPDRPASRESPYQLSYPDPHTHFNLVVKIILPSNPKFSLSFLLFYLYHPWFLFSVVSSDDYKSWNPSLRRELRSSGLLRGE